MMKVGFIGLGRMGKGMASRVLSGGHDLAVYDVAPQATAEFAQSGARVASSVADVCKDREVVITMLAEDFAVHEVAFGPGACALHCRQGPSTWRWGHTESRPYEPSKRRTRRPI